MNADDRPLINADWDRALIRVQRRSSAAQMIFRRKVLTGFTASNFTFDASYCLRTSGTLK